MRPASLVLAASIGVAVPVTAPAAVGGLVVETVEPDRAGDRAGLRPGDALTGWARTAGPGGPARGLLSTPADLVEAEDVQAPLGPLTLDVERGGEMRRVTMDGGEFGLSTRPALSPAVLADCERGRAAPRGQRARAWLRAARAARREGATEASWWLFLEAARVAAEAEARASALAALDEAHGLGGDDRVRRIQELEARGRVLQVLGEQGPAAKALQQALELRQQEDPDGLAAAAGLEAAGTLAWDATDVAAAAGFRARALHIRETLAPGTVVHARSLWQAGRVQMAQGHLDEAEALYHRALDTLAGLEPQGHSAGVAVLGLGTVALNRGRLDDAAALYHRMLDMRAAAEPPTTEVCGCRQNLAIIAIDRADLDTADRIIEETAPCILDGRPGKRGLWAVNLWRGIVAGERGELAAARRFFTRAVALAQGMEGNSAMALMNLGELEIEQGDLAAARRSLETALALHEKKYGRESLSYAQAMSVLGQLATRQGRPGEGRALLERSLAIYAKADAQVRLKAMTTRALGAAAEAARDPGRARELYEEALAAFERIAPGSYLEADTLHSLGRLRRTQGATAEGAGLLHRAVDLLERSDARVGGGQEGLSLFRARRADMYRDLVDAELDLGHVDEALHVVERSRGRVLLEWLARRRVGLPEDVTPEARREGDDIDAERERVQGQLDALSPARDAEQLDLLGARLRELQERRERWKESLRERAPHYAALRYPVALDAAGVRAALEPGTFLLSYVVGPTSTRLFVAGGGPARVYTIASGAEALRRRVTAFRTGIEAVPPAPARVLRRQARALFDLLLGPAEADLAAAERVLVSADGPLHLLPFGALVRKNQYVVEWRPLHFVTSATVYAELRRERRPGPDAPARLLAFGDPRPRPLYARRFPGLPGSRREVREIERRFADRATVYLGAAASEGRARGTDGAFDVVHFATHVSVDEHLPLDSALVLSPGPGEENGLLQVWEIFDGMRLDADLVTLSGCETALGREMGGEGLMGLTRAFLYAGARSVLASLWRVSDNSTAELMELFYRRLAAGAPKDEALRAAQIEMIHAGGVRALPFRWAAFELFGDRR